MKLLTIIIFGFILITAVPYQPVIQTEYNWIKEQILDEAVRDPKAARHINRKIQVIQKVSQEYDINYKLLTRLIRMESSFKRTAYNSGSGARGLCQVTEVWNYAAYYIDGKRLGHVIRQNNITNIDQYKHYIYYGASWGAFALKACIKYKQGCITNALKMYGGWYTKGADQNKASNYVSYVLNYN